MVATAANIKTPALPATLEVNGTAMATPSGAVGIVGKLEGTELYVVRNGQTVSLRAGDWLLEGDRVVTSSAAEQTLFFAGDATGSLRRVQFARGADFKIRNGEIYTTALMTSSMVSAAEALPQGIVAAGPDEAPVDADTSMAVEETSSISGLFGSPIAMGAASALGIGGGALALASVISSDSSDPAPASTPTTTPSGGDGSGGSNGSGNGSGNGNTGDGAGSGSGTGAGEGSGGDMDSGSGGGAFSSGGAQLDGLFADNPTGQTPPFSFADGGAMLEGASPVPLAAPASSSASPADALTQSASALLGDLPPVPVLPASSEPASSQAVDSLLPVEAGNPFTSGIGSVVSAEPVNTLLQALA